LNSYGDPAIRITLLPRDTNPQGTIFGGIILSYIDIAGAVEAHRRTGVERFVTVAMREVIFHQPVFVGDLVSFYSKIERIGTTSITVRVVVEAERYGGTSERIKVTEAEVDLRRGGRQPAQDAHQQGRSPRARRRGAARDLVINSRDTEK
jgi:acyl-CoA thioesterase YciA